LPADSRGLWKRLHQRFKEDVVTTLTLEHLGPVAGPRELRRRERARRQALDALGGRTVWWATALSTPLPRGCEQRGVAAFMAAPDAVAANEATSARGTGDWDPEAGWSRLLADVVRGGREEHVGGTRHARPAVAAR
jgi:hypothetical protein